MTSAATRRMSGAIVVARLLPIYLALAVAKHVVRIDRLARWAWRSPRPSPRAPGDEPRMVSLVLRLGAIAGRPDRDCLQRSLLLYRELSRAGADPRLFVGFRREHQRLVGHAWVECDGRPVTTEAIGREAFEATWGFGPGGRRLEPAADRAVRAS